MELADLGVVSLLQGIHLHTKSRIRDRCFVLLRHVQLSLLREPCASVPLTQDLELRPVCGELLRKTPLQLRRVLAPCSALKHSQRASACPRRGRIRLPAAPSSPMAGEDGNDNDTFNKHGYTKCLLAFSYASTLILASAWL